MRIVVTGARGFLGQYVVQELKNRGHNVVPIAGRDSADLRELEQARSAMIGAHVVVHCAAAVGGIGLNVSAPGRLFHDNMLMGLNVIEAARQEVVQRVVVIGTACEYPDAAPIPTPESSLWDGYPAQATASYAMAKKALLVMGQEYRNQYGLHVEHVIPSNLYGPHDHFDTETGHVIPSMIAKFSRAQSDRKSEVPLWGTGTATRDFLHVADAARGIADVAEIGTTGGSPINLGSGREITIANLAALVSKIYGGIKPVFTREVSDGVSRRLLNTTKARDELGWVSTVRLEEGLSGTVAWYEDWDL